MDGHVLMDMNEVISHSFSSSHKAIDIVGSGNSIDDVIAFDDGTVEIVVNTVTGNRKGSRGTASYGNFVKIRHDNGMKTLYAHMEYGSISVKTGDRVSKGQRIGRMGDTGNAYGVHLHFEIRQADETRIDPYSYLTGENQFELPNVEEVTNEEPTLTGSVSFDNPSGDAEGEAMSEANTTVENKNDNLLVTENTVDNSNEVVTTNPDIVDNSYLNSSDYKDGSIVDGLKSIGADSSFDYRTLIAYENGIKNYRGSYEQNVELLNLLKIGKLKKV